MGQNIESDESMPRTSPNQFRTLLAGVAVAFVAIRILSVPVAAQEIFVDQVDVDAFSTAAGSIFWNSDCALSPFPSGKVQRKPASGGPIFTVHTPTSCTAPERIWSETVAADSTSVFWIDAQGGVLERAWDGSGPQQIATMEVLTLQPLARPKIVAGDLNVYWVEHTLDSLV